MGLKQISFNVVFKLSPINYYTNEPLLHNIKKKFLEIKRHILLELQAGDAKLLGETLNETQDQSVSSLFASRNQTIIQLRKIVINS